MNKQVPDAASSATAMFTGVKVNQRTLGLDASYAFNEITHCSKTNSQDFGLETLATWAQAAGKDTGKIFLCNLILWVRCYLDPGFSGGTFWSVLLKFLIFQPICHNHSDNTPQSDDKTDQNVPGDR